MLQCLLILSLVLVTHQTPNTKELDLNPTVQKYQEPQKCMTKNNTEGACVLYYLCSENETIITDGAGIIDPRINERSCYSYLEVCCQLSDVRATDNPITPKPYQQREGCGWRNPEGVAFHVEDNTKGEFSEFGEFPWMVAVLRIENGFAPAYKGGGSLIHPSVVLTTAHKLDGAQKIRVRAGEWDTLTDKEIFPYQERDVAEVVMHKDYNKRLLFYDAALLFLSMPMEMAPNVGIACLPPPSTSYEYQETPPGTKCYASGWGKDRFGNEGSYSAVLKKVHLSVVGKPKCQDDLRKTRLGSKFRLHFSFMCAGGTAGTDTCTGDGGSPLVCPIEHETERYVQSGMVAWGIGCGYELPAVYVDVTKLRDWIDDKILGHAYETSVYTY